jgi:5-deoxy-glucuronate isomerase
VSEPENTATDPVVRAGDSAEGPFSLVITPERAGWGYSSLRVLKLAPGAEATFGTGDAAVR